MTLFTFAERRGVDEGTILLTGILLLCIFMPTAFFFAYQIWKRRMAIPIKARYPSITFCLTLFFCVKLAISGSICLLLWNDAGFSEWSIYKILLMADNVFLYLFLCANIWKLWRIKYNLNWSKATLEEDDAWRILINEEEANEYDSISWYLRHNVNCCCPSYLFFILLLFAVLIGINVPVQLYGYDEALTVYISRGLFTFCICAMIILYIVTPKQINGKVPNFELNKELKMIFFTNCCLLLICVCGFVYDLYYSSQFEDFAVYNQRNVNVLIEESLYFAMEWFLCMWQTFYVLVKTGEFIPFYLKRRLRKDLDNLGAMNGNQTRELAEVLSDTQLFEWFLSHLAAEFNLNLMLALIEFVQFKSYCSEHLDSSIQLKSDRIRIPNNMPQSTIVYDHDNNQMNDFFNLALAKYHKLYKKYFDNKLSNLQLDVRAKTKKYFDDSMGNESKWLYENEEVNSLADLMQHLDKSIGEIYHLTDESFQRFKQLNAATLFKEIPSLYMNTLSA